MSVLKISKWRSLDSVDSDEVHSPSTSTRLTSLDAFRGFAIAGMILVNNPGSFDAIYPQLDHAKWNGWTFADLIFPFFLFIVGFSIVISLEKKRSRMGNRELLWLIARRSVTLIGLGLLMHGFPHYNIATIRLPGTLQRIGICYGTASMIALWTKPRGKILWILSLLASYWLLMKYFPVPGIGAGVFEPGKNFAAYVDSLFLAGHMWQNHPTWDPEGIVSTIPAIATTLFGVVAGTWQLSGRSQRTKTAYLMGGGLVLIGVGYVLNQWLPINKSLWTSSYCIFTAGCSCVSFASLYWITDMRGKKRWAAFLVAMGVNAIALYVLSGLLNRILLIDFVVGAAGTTNLRSVVFDQFFLRNFDLMNASFAYSLSYLMVIFLIATIMKRKRWYVRL